jgi:hypothetical protein
MPDLSAKMKAAADRPDDNLDMGALIRRGKGLRTKRALGVSSLMLVVLSGAAWAAYELTGNEPWRNSNVVPARSPVSEDCEDKDPKSEGKKIRYCIASGTFEDSEGMVAPWSWYAYFNAEGDLCDLFEEPGGAGGGCGGPTAVKDISPGLSSVDEQDPILDLELPVDTATAFVETRDGDQLPVNVYDAPSELGISMKFGLYFHLPINALKVVALDGQGSVIASEDLAFIKKDRFPDFAKADGWMVSSGYIADEPWSISADNRGNAPLQCVSIGIGNDQEAADVEFGANWCSQSDDETALLLEQTWWRGLRRFAPIFGSVPREASSVALELDDGTHRDLPILDSPQDGMWPEPIYKMDFVVGFPPLGAEGQVVARAADGSVLSTWDLCLDPAATQGVEYAACDERTEFWQPPE